MVESVASLEFREVNEYVRHAVGTYFAWFSFFLTILFAMMGWSLKTSLDSTGHVRSPALFFWMVALFMVQIGLAIEATSVIMTNLGNANDRVAELLVTMARASPQGGYIPRSPVPAGYVGALGLARWALIGNIVFWPLIGIVVYRKWRNGSPMAGPARGEAEL